MATILDFKKPELSKIEKAIEMLQQQLNGLQRQIAGICLKKGISPKEFAEYNRKDQEILNFLIKAQEEEDIIVKKANDNFNIGTQTPTENTPKIE